MDQAKKEYNKLVDNPKYNEMLENDLLEKLDRNMEVFNQAMRTLGSERVDALTKQEEQRLYLFWFDLECNLRKLMELFNYADHVLKSKDYNPEKRGRYSFGKSVSFIHHESMED